ncbi:acyltransferase family protein [Halosquirtibacter xylanolyticus]|uniref:acyltransferase n=1 Tax=Halosquirtibacter xylanolyticus TaxID=3374599 RepID=UPI0037487E31|nr:acyltransferase family protein [Prolixibacteraceae bacterium]
MTKGTKGRETNLDLLRVVASLMVITVHVGNVYVTGERDRVDYNFIVGLFYCSISVSVALFTFLSGGFLLAKKENSKPSYFYPSILKRRILFPTLFWSLVYVLLAYMEEIVEDYANISPFEPFAPLVMLLKGQPCYHLWYMFMLIGLYLMVPILMRIKCHLGESNFMTLGVLLTMFAVPLSLWGELVWMLYFVKYLGYFILGYSLKRYYQKRSKSNAKTFLLLGISIWIIKYISVIMMVHYNFLDPLYLLNPLSPFNILQAILFYLFFLNITIKRGSKYIRKLSRYGFYVYIFHAIYVSIIRALSFKLMKCSYDPLFFIPLVTVIVYMLSLSTAYIWMELKDRYRPLLYS